MMRKIESKERQAKKKRNNQIIIGVVMIALLVLSTLGFALLNKDSNDTQSATGQGETQTINGFTFEKQSGYWVTQINGRINVFFNLPSELNDTNINITHTIGSFANKPLYFTQSSTIRDHIAGNLYPEYILRINNACLENETCVNETYPIKNCATDNIIVFKESSEQTNVYQKQNCIYIEGDVTKGADRFLYRIFTIA